MLPTTDTWLSVMTPQRRCFFFVCCFFPALCLLCLLVSILSVISLFFCSVSVCYSLQKKIDGFLLHLYLWNEVMVKALPIVFVNWQQIWQLMLPKWLGKTTSLPKELQFSENVYAPFLISDIFALFWDLLAYLALSNKFYFCWFLSIWVWPPKLNSAFWNIWLITVNS